MATLAGLRAWWADEQCGDLVEDPGYQVAFKEWFEHEHEQRVTWLAEVDGEPVGMLNMLVFTRMPKPGRRTSRWGSVANVYVTRPRRDGGVGQAMLEECLSYADRHAFARLVLSPSERAVPFYARAGFRPATSLMLREQGSSPAR